MGSESGRLLAEKLDTIRVYPEGRYRPKKDDVVINWGNSSAPAWASPDTHVVNNFHSVKIATNKYACFEHLAAHTVSTPPFTNTIGLAREWLHNGGKVVCRTVLNGHGGEGIVLAENVDELVPAPLYTYYIPKKHEYRIHIFNGEIIDISEKRMRNKAERPENFNKYIRNHDNGWVFCRNNIFAPDCVEKAAQEAMEALGLMFGAADVIYREANKQAYVLEVNTAPGMDDVTSDAYANAIRLYMDRGHVRQAFEVRWHYVNEQPHPAEHWRRIGVAMGLVGGQEQE
jgi:glutathione synthase/RimK-type ligase-like ATP-grasp enzyme